MTGGVWHPEGARNAIKLASIIAGGYEELKKRPIISAICCVISPLKLDKHYTELMIIVAENGIPVMVPSGGQTCPVPFNYMGQRGFGTSIFVGGAPKFS